MTDWFRAVIGSGLVMDLSTYFLLGRVRSLKMWVGSESDPTLVVHIKRLFIIIHNGKHELQSDVMSFHHVAAEITCSLALTTVNVSCDN